MNLKLIKAGLIVCAIAAFGYVMYSLFTQTGLCGYLMDLQIRNFGVAYQKLTAFAGIILFALPAAPFINYVKRRDQENANLNPQTAEERAARAKRNQWKVVLVLGIAPAIISFIAYPIVLYVDRADQERKIYKINVNEGGALPANDVKFAEVTGVYQPDYQYILEESRGSSSSKKQTMYVPLTENTWNAKQPIRYFLIAGFNGYTDPQTKRFSVLPNKGTFAGMFSVQVSENALPTFVANEYARKGLTVAAPHYVLTRMNDFAGGVKSRADSQMYYLIPVLGVGLSVVILVSGGLGLLIRKARGL